VLQPSSLKEISSRDLWKERLSKVGRSRYDNRLHDKLGDQDNWKVRGKHCRSWISSLIDEINFNVDTPSVE
jgi:hypothetical protein